MRNQVILKMDSQCRLLRASSTIWKTAPTVRVLIFAMLWIGCNISYSATHDFDFYTQGLMARLQRHANGQFVYNRRVYFTSGVLVSRITKADNVLTDLATTSELIIHDMNNAYFENVGQTNKKYRIDSVNLMPKPSAGAETIGGAEADQNAMLDYNRTYIYDSIDPEQVIVYRNKLTSDVLSIFRYKLSPLISYERPEITAFDLWPPQTIFFSPMAFWSDFGTYCTSGHVIDQGSTVRWQCKEGRSATLDAHSFYPLKYEFSNQLSGPNSRLVPAARSVLINYASFGGEMLPRTVLLQIYELDNKRQEEIRNAIKTPDKIPLQVTTARLDLVSAAFDKPEISDKIGLGDFVGQRMSDYRFEDQKHSGARFYTYRANMIDADILAMGDMVANAHQPTIPRIVTYGVLVAVAILIIIMCAYRLRYSRGRRE